MGKRKNKGIAVMILMRTEWSYFHYYLKCRVVEEQFRSAAEVVRAIYRNQER